MITSSRRYYDPEFAVVMVHGPTRYRVGEPIIATVVLIEIPERVECLPMGQWVIKLYDMISQLQRSMNEHVTSTIHQR